MLNECDCGLVWDNASSNSSDEVLVARISSLMPPAVSGPESEGRTRLLIKRVYAPKETCFYLTNVGMMITAVADE